MISKEKILHYLKESERDELYALADSIRKAHCGDEIHLRGIIEYSNYCRCNCLYCGLRAENLNLKRYRMTVEQIIETARKAAENDIRTIVFQAGEDPGFTVDDICHVIEGIIKLGDIAITLSSGEYPCEDYKRMRDAGAGRYLLKIETTNPEIYSMLHPSESLENRIRCLHDLRDLGFQLGSGGLIGLPGQTIDDIADDILFCVDLDLDMATFSPFIPHPDTPLANEPGGTHEFGTRVIAVLRIALPDTHIPCSTALATLSPDDYRTSLNAGANVVMADITPGEFVQYYDLYPGKAPTGEKKDRDNIARLKRLITDLGRPLASSRGDSLKR
jgi:biotin synthase